MSEGTNFIRKALEWPGILVPPAVIYYFFPDHPVWWVLSFFLAPIAKFVSKVWDRIEPQYVDAVAKWLPPKIKSLFTRYRARYRRAIYFQHRSFDVKGLNTQGAFSPELDQVFVELSLSPIPPHKVSNDPLRKPIEVGERLEIWDFLRTDNYRHLAILGPPGSGKTTLLKHLALALVGPRRKLPLKLTPVLLYLRDLAKHIPNITLPEAMERSLPDRYQPPEGWARNELEKNRCLILLDGLDEVADTETRRTVAKWIEERMREYGDTRFLITSRPNGYRTTPLEGVTVLDVKPFTWPQVEKFVKKWYLATETIRAGKRDTGVELDAEKGTQDLLQRLGSAPALTDLAVNPLLLTMITTVHRERNSLPDRRAELYKEICEVFLGKRQQSKGLPLDLTPAQKQRVLEPLAWHMMETQVRKISVENAHIQIAPVLALVSPTVDAARFLESVRDDSGLVVEQEKDEYAFAHLTFQEYLASTHAKAASLESELVQRVSEPWWSETIRLYAASNNATRIAEACIKDAPSVECLSLAMDCLEEALELSLEVRARIEDLAIASLDSPERDRRKIAAEVLLARFLHSMVRVSEDTYVSRELVPNAVYEQFLSESPQILPPCHWSGGTFPTGEGRQPVVGVSPPAACTFCEWLSARSLPIYGFDLPSRGSCPERTPCWIREEKRIACQYLPWDWQSAFLELIRKRLASEAFAARMAALDSQRNLALDSALDRASSLITAVENDRALGGLPAVLDLGLALDQARGHDLDFILARDRDLPRNFALDRDLDHTRDRALARVLSQNRDCVLDSELNNAVLLAQALNRSVADKCAAESKLAEIEVLSVLSLHFVRVGTQSEKVLRDLFLASALALEQRAGAISAPPVGVALVRTNKQAVQKTAGD